MRLRRKSEAEAPGSQEDLEVGAEEIGSAGTEDTEDAGATGEAGRPLEAGPLDVSEVDPETTYIDLGSLLIAAGAELELRLQVEEDTGQVLSVLLVADEGVLETRAFASSRGGDLWADARAEIAADTVSRGGKAHEQDGPFGTELYCELPVVGQEGEQLIQPSRIIGYNGPRWFLRATIAGRPAKDPEYAVAFEQAIRKMAVRRGSEAMAPGEALPLKLPPEARPQTQA